MKIVFVSNFYNHHQAPTALEWYRLCEGNFYFISTTSVPEERASLGYQKDGFPQFVLLAYKSEEEKRKSIDLINDADVVIIGSASDEYIKQRLQQKKLTFRCHERLYKTPWNPKYAWKIKAIHFIKHRRHENLYLLCCSAFTAADYAKTNCFRGKSYKWGYFPQVRKYYDIDKLISKKQPASLMWCGRMINWKHPEHAIMVAKALKEKGYSFSMNLIGNGALESDIRNRIEKEGLTHTVHMLGAMSPEKVREYMEQSDIFLFTSDRGEGWGAVLNESMNSACAVVASKEIGATPYLIQDGTNGMIYQNSDVDMLIEKVIMLLDHHEMRKSMQKAAYESIVQMWNAEVAARRFLQLAEQLLSHKREILFQDGPCSKAPLLMD